MLLFLSADSPEPKGRKAVVMLTLRKLKEMVESPKKGEKKPSCKSLREGKYPVVAQKIIKNKVGVRRWRNMIKRMTFASLCADEIYKQTILCKYAADTIFYDEYGNTTDLRYVDWSEGEDHPKTLDDTDYEKIMSSGKLFARKFDEEKSRKIIDRIYGSV